MHLSMSLIQPDNLNNLVNLGNLRNLLLAFYRQLSYISLPSSILT
jgi:hypothetical protein